jgi:hypothetical protein
MPRPKLRFVADKKVVVDRLTGLMWTLNASLNPFPEDWNQAFQVVKKMNQKQLFGYRDWRLPEYRELFSLISHRNINPALPTPNPFVTVLSGYYWTATPCSRLSREAWYVHLGGGRVFKGMKHGAYMVWPVRRFTRTGVEHPLGDPAPDMIDCGTEYEMNVEGATGTVIDLTSKRFKRSERTVIDRSTGLMWWPDASPYRKPVAWDSALNIVRAMNRSSAGGFDDWRLPNIREIAALVDTRFHSPALPAEFRELPVDPGCWTSTSSAYDPRYAWVLYTQDRALGVGYKVQKEFNVLAVRDLYSQKASVTGTAEDTPLRQAAYPIPTV